MQDRYKLEAFYWRAFALLALAGKRSLEDFRAELDRCVSGVSLTDEDVAKTLNEFYAALGPALDSIRPRLDARPSNTNEGSESGRSALDP